MFTGIIENPCEVVETRELDGRRRLVVDLHPLRAHDAGPAAAPLAALGDSVAVDGCCLTIAALDGDRAAFDVIPETLELTSLGDLRAGARVNVERALAFGDRIDGHLVQGHVETAGTVRASDDQGGQWWLSITCGRDFALRSLHKGSVTIAGVSLTIAELGDDHLAVALVPHTLERTTLGERRVGDRVNLEADLIGAWVRRVMEARQAE